jgi:hypothetical protein
MLCPFPMKQRSLKQRSDDGNAFLPESAARTGTDEELAELLAEAHQAAVITGESLDDGANDVLEPEEIGGPFVETDRAQEFGDTRHDPVDDEYEPNSLPQAVGSLAVASPEEEAEAVEVEDSGDVDAPDAEGEAASQIDPEPIRRATTKL